MTPYHFEIELGFEHLKIMKSICQKNTNCISVSETYWRYILSRALDDENRLRLRVTKSVLSFPRWSNRPFHY